MSHPNVDLIQRGFDAFAAGDMAALAELFAPDLVWHVGGRNRFTGDYEGMGAVMQYLGEFVQSMDSFSQDVHAILADDEHGVALAVPHARRGDKSLDTHNAIVFHINDGKVTEAWVVPVDSYAWDEFWTD